jgi:hypothetical protein
METIQDFLNKLDKLSFTSYGDKTLHTEEEFEISHNIEITSMSSMPLQFIFRIRKENVYVTSWGCSSNDDNSIACNWWQRKITELCNTEYANRSEKQDHFKNQFNKL